MALTPPDFAARFPQLAALAQRGVAQTLAPDEVLLREGEHGDALYILVSGRLRVYGEQAGGREVPYGTCEPGDYVGEMGLDGGPRTASVQALQACTLVRVNREGVLDHLREDPAFALALMGKVMRRIRSTQAALKAMQAGPSAAA